MNQTRAWRAGVQETTAPQRTWEPAAGQGADPDAGSKLTPRRPSAPFPAQGRRLPIPCPRIPLFLLLPLALLLFLRQSPGSGGGRRAVLPESLASPCAPASSPSDSPSARSPRALGLLSSPKNPTSPRLRPPHSPQPRRGPPPPHSRASPRPPRPRPPRGAAGRTTGRRAKREGPVSAALGTRPCPPPAPGVGPPAPRPRQDPSPALTRTAVGAGRRESRRRGGAAGGPTGLPPTPHAAGAQRSRPGGGDGGELALSGPCCVGAGRACAAAGRSARPTPLRAAGRVCAASFRLPGGPALRAAARACPARGRAPLPRSRGAPGRAFGVAGRGVRAWLRPRGNPGPAELTLPGFQRPRPGPAGLDGPLGSPCNRFPAPSAGLPPFAALRPESQSELLGPSGVPGLADHPLPRLNAHPNE